MAARGPKMADGVWKGVQSYVIGHSRQLSLNRFFYSRTPSMRKVDNGEKIKKDKDKLGLRSGKLKTASTSLAFILYLCLCTLIDYPNCTLRCSEK